MGKVKNVYWNERIAITRDCWCGKACDYEGTGYCKWGQVDIWRCPDHGIFQEVDEPMSKSGQQIR